MINFLKKLFGFRVEDPKKNKPTIQTNTHAVDHDMIDYDGMGNQGRFPMHK